ncbi:hypothetical protein Poli38472_005081 [Pythium oligandrum]|uniref:SET domain-containing protein n=1 Tax=Pythium oligandrum TaxID=41045 RepID=A0A8K1CG94_PYTOL|nr:hypothetical protein Poli38472_005081 [Pythium oligandrum]|eukprot:TMW62463.1 hypothetical protein Poli38472_005081 [Pythium oligandrum]
MGAHPLEVRGTAAYHVTKSPESTSLMAPASSALSEAMAATQPLSLCTDHRCLDRDACYSYDEISKVTRLTHPSEDCTLDATLTIAYLSRNGDLERISVERAEELMRCTYTSKLLFQSSSMLRNYAFWGFSDIIEDGFQAIAVSKDDCSLISPHVAVGHVALLGEMEDNALGLFATADFDSKAFLGEYTGVIMQPTDASHTGTHDPYGISYPSVFEGGQLHVSALEFGNVIRCINHSDAPNAHFAPMLLQGILHIYCFTTRPVKAGEQIFVDYGPAYWKHAGVEPIAC